MKFPLYIALRYLFAKKSHNAINIITAISATGVMVGAMSLVIVLSVFNGLERLILSLFNAFHPDLEIRIVEGRAFHAEDLPLDALSKIPGIYVMGQVLEETALITYRNKQQLITMRGVCENYGRITGIDTLMTEGVYFQGNNDNQLIMGLGVAMTLNAPLDDFMNPMVLYVPRRGRIGMMNPAQAFVSESAYPAGVFSVHADYDAEYVLVPIELARRLTARPGGISMLALKLDGTVTAAEVQREVENALGGAFSVKSRIQQQEFLYKIMQSEKTVIFLILSFILLIAAFNIIGSLTMLVIEKQKDIGILHGMGASRKTIQQVFMLQGVLISSGGAMAGILLGVIVCALQMHFGIIGIQAEGQFIVDAYPVWIKGTDLLLTAATVICIGLLASLMPLRFIPGLPARNMSK